MSSQQERQPQKELNITYDVKATQALEFAREKARIDGRKLVNFGHLIEGINSQISPQEKPDIYKAYGIEEYDIKLANKLVAGMEHLDFARLEFAGLEEGMGTDSKLQFSPRAQRAVQYAELFAALKQDQTLDVYDLFRGVAKAAEDEITAL